MSAEIQCSQTLLLQADFDGELDAAQSAALEAHRENCALCTQALSKLERARALTNDASRYRAPNALREKVLRQLQSKNEKKPNAPKWLYLVSSGGVGALAAGLLTFVLFGAPKPQTADWLVDNHLRAMQSPAHLLDVASTEHHTVKPWFAGRIDFAPPVKDLEGLGYPLRGGRVDVVTGHNVAVMVYQAGNHSIDVSVEPLRERRQPMPLESRGFNIRQWTDGEFNVWAISDLNARELDAFVEHWKAAR